MRDGGGEASRPVHCRPFTARYKSPGIVLARIEIALFSKTLREVTITIPYSSGDIVQIEIDKAELDFSAGRNSGEKKSPNLGPELMLCQHVGRKVWRLIASGSSTLRSFQW